VNVGRLAFSTVILMSGGLACERSLESAARDAAMNGAVTPVADGSPAPNQDAAPAPAKDAGPCGFVDAGDTWSYATADQVASFGWNDAGATTLVSPEWIAAQCARSTCFPLKATSIGDSQKLLVRRWARCSPLGPFHTPEDGIQIKADGTYTFLTWSAGALIPETGDVYDVGRVQYIDASAFNRRPAIQVDFDAGPGDAGIGGIGSFPDFYLDPPIFSFNNNGVETYRFLALP
jgi:hypothetical protein